MIDRDELRRRVDEARRRRLAKAQSDRVSDSDTEVPVGREWVRTEHGVFGFAPKYPAHVRETVVRRAFEAGVNQAAREFRIPRTTVSWWKKLDSVPEGK